MFRYTSIYKLSQLIKIRFLIIFFKSEVTSTTEDFFIIARNWTITLILKNADNKDLKGLKFTYNSGKALSENKILNI